MPYSKEIFNIAKDRLNERRQQALRLSDFRREQLFNEIPELREINNELLSIGAGLAKAILKEGSEGKSIRELSERSLSLQKRQDELLSQRDIDKAAFEPRFYCSKCEDTGYVEDNNRTLVCDCFKKLMSEAACEQLSDSLPIKNCTFNSFSLDCYSSQPDENGKIPLNRMSKIYNYCVSYADNFTPHSKSILMRGNTGLGKTHLSLAIANEVIQKGMSVIYVSAPAVISKLEKEHFSYQYGSKEDTFNSLLNCDLLIIDDLGTEFITQFSISCIYNLFNSRLLADKPLIFSTNLTLAELINAYSQRFVSRLLGSCERLDFIGNDFRTP